MNDFGFRLPENFLIGTANSAFQSEGAVDRDGKSESIMEYYAKKFAGKTPPYFKEDKAGYKAQPYSEHINDEGCFFYDNYEAYIDDMKKTGQNTFRMSLAWPRIIPTGTGAVNQTAIDHYNKVIDKLLSCGIEPFVDIYHWDMPQCLMDQGGFLNPDFPEWFEAYAKVCFENFGDRIKYWSTFNETQVSIASGHMYGSFPPFLRSRKSALLAGHHVLLAHFRAIRLYKSLQLGGKIGAVNCITNVTPIEMNEKDLSASLRQTERDFGWWTEPMVKGTYPQVLLRECPKIKADMPEHFQDDLDKWFVPMDFIGVNYYISRASGYDPDSASLSKTTGSFYAAPGQSFASYPPGIFDVIQNISDAYPGMDIFITENGCAIPAVEDEETSVHDAERITYIREHLRMVARAIRAGYPVKGYYYWNDADSYEELSGYDLLFGLTWVDRKTGRTRWKDSRYYFSEICKSRIIN